MQKISNNMDRFITAVETGKAVSCNSRGEWKVQNWFVRFIYWIFGLRSLRDASIAKAFAFALGKLEKIPVGTASVSNPEESGGEIDYQKYIHAAKVVMTRLKDRCSSRIRSARLVLRSNIVALKYRLENITNYSKKDAESLTKEESERYDSLLPKAQKWKKNFFPLENREWTPADEKKLISAVRHTKFSKLLCNSVVHRNKFFRWICASRLSVKAFIQFPSTIKSFEKSEFLEHIGAVCAKQLKVEKIDGKKELTVGFVVRSDGKLETEKRRYSILNDETEIAFTDKFKVTVGKMRKLFEHRLEDPDNCVIVSQNGVTNWNPIHHGPTLDGKTIEKTDFSKDNWWEKLEIFENLTDEETFVRYQVPDDNKAERPWLSAAVTVRESPTMDVEGTHAFAEIAIPQKDGGYRVYSFGKVPFDHPVTLWQKIKIAADTKFGTLATPDANLPLMNFRRHATRYSFVMNETESKALMNKISQSIIDGLNKQFHYQFQWENCAHFVQTTFEEIFGKQAEGGKVPNFFIIRVDENRPKGFLGFLFGILRLFPRFMRGGVFRTINMGFAPWRGVTYVDKSGRTVKKAVWNSEGWRKGIGYHPAVMPMRLDPNRKRNDKIPPPHTLPSQPEVRVTIEVMSNSR